MRYILRITINQRTTLQNKETTVQSYRKMSNKNTENKRALGTSLHLLTVQGR